MMIRDVFNKELSVLLWSANFPVTNRIQRRNNGIMDVRQTGITKNNRRVVHREKLFRSFLLHFHDLSAQGAHLGMPDATLVVGKEAVGDVTEKNKEDGDLL